MGQMTFRKPSRTFRYPTLMFLSYSSKVTCSVYNHSLSPSPPPSPLPSLYVCVTSMYIYLPQVCMYANAHVHVEDQNWLVHYCYSSLLNEMGVSQSNLELLYMARHDSQSALVIPYYHPPGFEWQVVWVPFVRVLDIGALIPTFKHLTREPSPQHHNRHSAHVTAWSACVALAGTPECFSPTVTFFRVLLFLLAMGFPGCQTRDSCFTACESLLPGEHRLSPLEILGCSEEMLITKFMLVLLLYCYIISWPTVLGYG
jgi:hypothetical protein